MTAEKKHHITFGTHEAWFVEPDELGFVFRGVFDGEHADPYLNFVFEQGDRVGRPLYAAYDLSAFSHATPRGATGSSRRVARIRMPHWLFSERALPRKLLPT